MKNNTVTRLLAYVGKSKKTLLFVFVTVLVGNVSLLLAPRYIGDAVDLLAEGGDGWERAFVTLLALIAGLYAVGSFLQWLSARAGKLVAFRTTNAIVRDAFAKLGRLPLSFFDTHKHGDVIHTLTNDADMVAEGLSQGIIQFISGVLSIVISLVMMLMLDVRVTLVAVFVTPLCFFVGWAITRYGSRRFRAQAGTLGDLNGFAEEYISSFHTVKLFSYEPNAVEAFGRINAELYQSGYRAQFASALVNPTTRFVNNIAYVLVGVFSLLSVLDGNLTAGGITAFLTYTSQFSKPFNEITAITTQIQNAAASARRIFGLLDEREQQPEPSDAVALHDAQGSVAFRDVSFSYSKEKPLIRHFSFTAAPGTTVAIVGPTGAGKTTLVNLLMRFYELDGGVIEVDGRDITTLTRDSLRRSFGMVLQETWLFDGTVAENIAYGRPNATMDEITAAAKAAYAHSFIKRLPEGYQTMIEGGGANLSAGQKQLLTIARAMLADTSMLILDEATSNVDILTEIRIQKAFRSIMEGKTTFIIAHRLSTIRDADVILVMDKGDVVEAGTHEELLQKEGIYKTLVQKSMENPSEM